MELGKRKRPQDPTSSVAPKARGRGREVSCVPLLDQEEAVPTPQNAGGRGRRGESKKLRVLHSRWKTSTTHPPIMSGTRSWIHKTASDFSSNASAQQPSTFPSVLEHMAASVPQFYPTMNQQNIVAASHPVLLETVEECRQFLTKSLVTAQETNLPLSCLVACPCESFKRALRTSLDRKVNCALRARRNPVSFTCAPFPTPIYQSLFPAHSTGAIRERTQTITSITHTVTNPRQLDHIFGENWDVRPIRMSTEVKHELKHDDKDEEEKHKLKEKKHPDEEKEGHVLNGTFELMPTANGLPQVKLCFDLDNESLSLKTKFRFVDENSVVLF